MLNYRKYPIHQLTTVPSRNVDQTSVAAKKENRSMIKGVNRIPRIIKVVMLSSVPLMLFFQVSFRLSQGNQFAGISNIDNNKAKDGIDNIMHYNGTTQAGFRWDMIDLSVPGVCGHHKCFFLSKENPGQVGYAVSSYHPHTMAWVWDQARMLEERYNAHHVYLDAPQTIKVSRDLLSIFIGRRDQNFGDDTMHQNLNLKDFIHFAEPRGPEDEKKMTIQKLRVIPKPFLEIGHSDRRKNFVKNEWNAFTVSISNKTSYADRLLQEERKLGELLIEEPWLKANFQILIDNEGRIFHFDLDRSYNIEKERFEDEDPSRYLNWIREIAMEV